MDIQWEHYTIVAPGRIVEYFPANQTATVIICAERVFNTSGEDDIPSDRGTIEGVPVHTSSGGGFALTHPIAVGDTCLLLFSQFGYDHWLNGDKDKAGKVAGRSAPWLKRRFKIQDGFALVGFNTIPRAVQSYSADHSQWRNAGATSLISLDANGDIDTVTPSDWSLTAGTGTIVAPTSTWLGDIELTGDLTQTGDIDLTGNFDITGDETGVGAWHWTGDGTGLGTFTFTNVTVTGVFTMNSAITFGGAATFESTATFEGTTTNEADATFQGDILLEDNKSIICTNLSDEQTVLISDGMIELGNQDTAAFAVLDFHTSGNGNDFDSRILGGAGTGHATLSGYGDLASYAGDHKWFLDNALHMQLGGGLFDEFLLVSGYGFFTSQHSSTESMIVQASTDTGATSNLGCYNNSLTRTFAVTVNGNCYNTNGTYTTLSDGRRKRAVVDEAYGREAIKALHPVSYILKADETNERRTGFIAQEVLTVIPEAVEWHEGEPERVMDDKVFPAIEEYYTINMQALIPALVGAVSELDADNHAQQAMIVNQRNRIKTLEDRVQQLHTRLLALEGA